ncbi:uncharacterized protein LOC128629175 [Ictalurus punctatus]|uniref:Uncharacterized protein LOC128629175 n=1 Tax=Ictalurus punctatus TaxID=7998 RepID=A0A9F7R8H9_ICTPU|nr:uncharacterized protein LOC128629175 [Ictalurus punctatus]XP_053531988.1 uncharacterized protein LOC128629175 [Ictalurus punctatus]
MALRTGMVTYLKELQTEWERKVTYVRSTEQVLTRWKILKTSYYRAKKQNNPSGFPYFESMHDILGHRPLSNISESGLDIGFDEDEDAAEHLNSVEESVVGDEVSCLARQEEMNEYADEDTTSSGDTSGTRGKLFSHSTRCRPTQDTRLLSKKEESERHCDLSASAVNHADDEATK